MSATTSGKNTSARTGALVFTSLSVVLAASGGWLVWRLLTVGGYNREPMRQVVVAREPIGAGHPLRAESLRVVPWPASAVPDGAFGELAPLLKPQAAVSTAGFAAGEPILKERLASMESGTGLSALVGTRGRAVTVQVDRSLAAARLVYPGAHVDVLVTLEDRQHAQVVTRTVLEDVRVLAVGTFADVDAARRSAEPGKLGGEAEAVVTLEVAPADAERLVLSARQGKIDLSLRNASDRTHGGAAGVAVGELVRGTGGSAVADAAREEPIAAAPPSAGHRRSASTSGAPVVSAGAGRVGRSTPQPTSGEQRPQTSSTIEVYSAPIQTR